MIINIVDIINKKRLGQILSDEELEFAFNSYLNGSIPDYQMSALLMAICIKGMTDDEIFKLTDIFIKSGDILDLSSIDGVKVDKHSTGGVGDKTTLVVGPIVSSCGVKMAKMSGRGLGHTGGTIDKLESIKGINLSLTTDEYVKQLNDIGFAISSQTGNLTPLDKKVYSLRDVTATVESIPLIAVSIMSKKIASGTDKILIDIKVGSGALIKNSNDAKKLQDIMIKIGNKYNKEVRTIITDMNVPLGKCIGNALEVLESIEILKGNLNSFLADVCIDISTNLVSMAKGISMEDAKKEVLDVIHNEKAYNKFIELVLYQHGDFSKLEISNKIIPIKSNKSGRIVKIDAYKIGIIARNLGAGRITIDDQIDYGVGVVLNKTLGSTINNGDIFCYLYVNDDSKYSEDEVLDSFEVE